ncbi:MAG: hypothetical protein R2769_12425 [Saprospiraceae bacterium]
MNRYYTTDPTYTFIGNFIGEDREKVDGGDGFNLYNINAAYVGDNSFSGVASPLKGIDTGLVQSSLLVNMNFILQQLT